MKLFKTKQTSETLNFDAFENLTNREQSAVTGGCWPSDIIDWVKNKLDPPPSETPI